mgnify:CR=1 FL=1
MAKKKPKFGVNLYVREKPKKRPGRHKKRLNKHEKRQKKSVDKILKNPILYL